MEWVYVFQAEPRGAEMTKALETISKKLLDIESCPWTDEEKRRVVEFFKLLHKIDCRLKEENRDDRPGQD